MSSSKFESLDVGKLGLIQESEDGRIVQIGLSQQQSDLLQNFAAILSQESPLVQLGTEYDMIQVWKCKKKKK